MHQTFAIHSAYSIGTARHGTARHGTATAGKSKATKFWLLPLILLFIFAPAVFAGKVVAVLEFIPTDDEVSLKIAEFRHLTDELRKQATQALPNGYTVLTRDNLIQLMPPDSDDANCLAESCAVEIGRAIGAEYVTQGTVGMFQGLLTLTVELYESMSGKLLGSFVVEQEDARGLLAEIRKNAPELFGRMPKLSEPLVHPRLTDVPDSTAIKTDNYPSLPVQTLIPNTQPKKNSVWVALSLDVLGAVALGFGIYKHIDANNKHSDYEKKYKIAPNYPRELNYNEIKDLGARQKSDLNKANDARKMGNIGVIAGGVLLTTGVMIHVWF